MKKMLKLKTLRWWGRLAGMFAGVALFWCMFAGVPVLADTDSTGMDVILVMDVSGSMRYTDPNKVSLDGAKLFIDMMESSGSRVGVVAFSADLVQVYDLTSMDSTADKDAVKSVLGSLEYGGETDIGEALEQAVNMLTSATDIGNNKVIIFFTDGKIEFPSAGDNEAQVIAESESKAQAAISTAASAGIPIYTIGLNADGNVDVDLLNTASSSTGATTNIVTSASELPAIFNDIFADFVETEINDLGDFVISDANTPVEKTFEIPNDSVLEANIVMITSEGTGGITSLTLVDPSGNSLSPDGSSIILSQSDNYYMLKLIGPSAGTWTLQVLGDQGCEVHVNLLFNYDIVLVASGAEATDGSGDLVIWAILQKNGVTVTDDTLYAQMTTTAYVTKEDGTVTSYPMELADNAFGCTVPVEPEEVVTVYVHTEGANMYRDSNTFQFQNSLQAVDPLVVKAALPNPITIKGLVPSMAKTTLNLDNYFEVSDPTGNQIAYYTIQGTDLTVASVDISGSELTLKGVSKGETSITVQAVDAQGNTVSQSAQVIVNATFGSILPLILIPVVVIILILLIVILLLKGKSSKLVGYLFWELRGEDGYGNGNEEQYDLSFAKKKALVSNFVTDFSLAYAGLDKVEITGNKDGLQVQNKGKTCVLTDSNGGEVKKTKIFDGGSFNIVCQTEDGDKVIVALRYQRNMNSFGDMDGDFESDMSGDFGGDFGGDF